MTPEERAELILASIESVQDHDYRLGFIEQSIRDVVAEAEKAAFQKARTAAAIEGGQAITPMLDQARAALEPFAKVASWYYCDGPPYPALMQPNSVDHYLTARDAYLALGGKLE